MTTRTEGGALPMTGWAMFSAIWLVLAGTMNIVEGITAIHRSSFYASQMLFSHPSAWGWIILIIGIVQVAAGWLVFSGNMTGYTMGTYVAMFAAFIWFFFLFAAPIAALIAVIVNGLVIYGLTIGSEQNYR